MRFFAHQRVPAILLLLFGSLAYLSADARLETEVRMRIDTGGLGTALAFGDGGWRAGIGIDGDRFSLYRPGERPEPVTRNWELFAEGRVPVRGPFVLRLGGAGFLQTLSFAESKRSYLSSFVTLGASPRLSLARELGRGLELVVLYAPRLFYSSHSGSSLEEEFDLDVYPFQLAPHLYFMWAGPVYFGGRVRFALY